MKDPLKAGIFLFFTWLLFGFSVTAAETPFEPVGDFAHARASYFTTRDGLKLYYQEVWPVQELRGIILFFQGIGGGGGRSFFSDAMVANGYGVIIVHQRGTGYSEGKRGDLKSFDPVVEDYKELVALVGKEYPETPIFICGHSLGGSIGVRLAAEGTPGVTGLILINPGTKFLQAESKTSFREKLGWFFNYLFRRSKPIISLIPEDIEHAGDQKEIEEWKNDPLVLDKMSIRYAMAALKVMEACVANARRADWPLLLVYGEEDEVIEHSTATEEMFEAWRGADKTRIIVAGAGHGWEITKLVWTDVLTWLNKHVGEPED
ncbi:MAG: alpha/beta hydrolase [Firmicutes bacterium]|jgi:alpha-beta hydrolase superfamily lysophospholipase|nr:alpha/beta hydrolase [Bacillota bacterium]